LNLKKQTKTSDLCFNGKSQVKWEKSSTNKTLNLQPLIEFTGEVHTSERISSRGKFDMRLEIEKGSFLLFAS
jgi:hypothetical protein